MVASSLHCIPWPVGLDLRMLAEGPLPFPENWTELVDAPQTAAEHDALRRSVARGAPYGDPAWQTLAARRLSLESSLRPPNRPKQEPKS